MKKNLNLLLNSLINCISARSAPQVLSIIDECTFLFLNFLIIGLCNSSANCLLNYLSPANKILFTIVFILYF